ncbi:MAG: hypothetical protein U1A78_27510 [Polyangia bacterium]
MRHFFALVIGMSLVGCGADSVEESVEVAAASASRPDLIVESITRDATYYKVRYCNVGTGSSSASFTIKLTNTLTGEAFTSNPIYPYSVPAPGTCATTGGFTCGLIGDPSCSQCMRVEAVVDSGRRVTEASESNNRQTATIGCLPDLVLSDITREAPYYRAKVCNNGLGTSSSTFTVQLTNASTGESFTSNPLYPYSVPAPGSCVTTGGMTCGLIGDKVCAASIDVTGKVDPVDSVAEASESNNTLTVGF